MLKREKPFALSRNEASVTSVLPEASTILASLGQAAFVWDIATDALAWSEDLAAVFPEIPAASLRSGAEFSKLIEPERSIRSDALTQSAPVRNGGGAPYRIEYGVRTSSSAPVLWIEETVCWFAGADGRPARVQGIVRVNNERHARDEQLLKMSRHDPLTGELNRTNLVAVLAEAVEEAARHRSSGAHQRRLRFRCRRRRDLGSGATASVADARWRRAGPVLRQQIRADPEKLFGRGHEYRRRAISRRHS
jgi:hypothetical protein